jgi:flagellar basal-body rod modification protein FlgD
MSTANAVNGVFNYPTSTPSAGASGATSSGMGKDTFLKLLMAQMSNQNPMEPTDDKEMLAQLAQFSTLEQMTSMATSQQSSAAATQMSQAVNLLGRTVTYLDADGAKQTGTVDQVSMANGAPALTIAGDDGITTSQITQVR